VIDLLRDLAEGLGGHSSPVRASTMAHVMRAVAQQLGGGVRRDMAVALEVSAGTVSKAITHLEEMGLVEEHGKKIALGPGRPLAPLQWTKAYAVAGVKIFDKDGLPYELVGTVIRLNTEPLPEFMTSWRHQLTEEAQADGKLFLDELATFIQKLVDAVGVPGSPRLLGCGVTLSGHVDKGSIRLSYNTGWGVHRDSWAVEERFELRDHLEKRLNMSVVLDNEVTSLAVRQNLQPQSPQEAKGSYALLAVLDEGVGGALVIGGATWRGHEGMAAEPGHLDASSVVSTRLRDEPAALDTPLCRCRQGHGHVESFASPQAIRKRAAALGLSDIYTSIGELSARPRSDTGVAELFLQGGIALARAAVPVINWVNPERIIIYLPQALHERNDFLAGSFYVTGLFDEIKKKAFSSGSDTTLVIRPKTDAQMEARLADAAAHLVIGKLIDLVAATSDVYGR
jgi:predicted NBD/HSP70 family sugar kinase